MTTDALRLHVAMQALSLLRYYTPVFPDDHVPYRAVAMAMDLAADEDVLTDMREAIHGRVNLCTQLMALSQVQRGWLVAAQAAIRLVEEALGDANPEEARIMVQLARMAMKQTGVEKPA